MKVKPVVSVVVNAHREGLIAPPSLKSVSRAKAYANAGGSSVELIAVADKPDGLTKEVLAAWSELGVRIIEVDYGDLGQSRNRGVQEARGDYVAFLDADDLWGENWLAEAVSIAKVDRRDIVWHPEVNIYFGEKYHIWRHIDMEDREFDPLSLAAGNCWTALCFARRDLLIRMPYPETNLAAGVGFEDWGWYRQTIAAGIIHKVVRGTGHAIRNKPISLVKQTSAAGALPVPTTLFRQMLEERARAAILRQSLGPSAQSTQRAKPDARVAHQGQQDTAPTAGGQ